MEDATVLAGAAAGPDPHTGLRAALALRRLAEALESLQVRNARSRGWSWQEIAEALEVSKQAVHKKYSDARPGRPSEAPRGGNDVRTVHQGSAVGGGRRPDDSPRERPPAGR